MIQDPIFTPSHLDVIVRRIIPPDAKPNVVIGTVDATGAEVVASFTKQAGAARWTFQGAARLDWSGGTTVDGRVLYEWD